MDWILFEKRGMDCVCKATTGHVNMFFFFQTKPYVEYRAALMNPCLKIEPSSCFQRAQLYCVSQLRCHALPLKA